MDHTITLGLEAVPVPVSPTIRFGVSGAGFDQGKFGSGLDDSSNIAIFDGTGAHVFDQMVFAG
jgi:hypothetical protein